MTAEPVPTTHDARRAADAIAGVGVRRVLLFGSVAHGRASPRSDIDLVAIEGDLDYAVRLQRTTELERVARDACGWPTEVLVTDEPEWRVRTTRVRSSFEAHIATHAIELAANDSAEEAIDWNKPIGHPDNDTADIADRLRTVIEQLYPVERFEEPARGRAERAKNDVHEARRRRVGQVAALAGSYQAIIAAARAMHAATLGAAPPKGDDLAVLLAAQPGWVHDAFWGTIETTGAPLAEMHYWRDRGGEQPDRHTRRVDAAGVEPAADAAYAIAGWICDHLPLNADSEALVRDLRWDTDRRASRISRALSS